MRFRRSPYIFHRCRMFAEYRRARRAAICFIHFSHSKFITFRKTDSFIPCMLKLFSTALLDINDYGKIVIDSRTNFASSSSICARLSILLRQTYLRKNKMLRLRRLEERERRREERSKLRCIARKNTLVT